LHREASATENRFATKDAGVANNKALCCGMNMSSRHGLTLTRITVLSSAAEEIQKIENERLICELLRNYFKTDFIWNRIIIPKLGKTPSGIFSVFTPR
jgi:hypothetical protein